MRVFIGTAAHKPIERVIFILRAMKSSNVKRRLIRVILCLCLAKSLNGVAVAICYVVGGDVFFETFAMEPLEKICTRFERLPAQCKN